jgi:thiamine-phosphate pyrophosphorylase
MRNSLKISRLGKLAEIDIYPVVTSEFTRDGDSAGTLRKIAAGGAKIVQLREKSVFKKELFKLALIYREITAERGMLLIINDHTDIALAVGADGVHLGLDDMPVHAARKIAPELIIGASSHNIQEALQAQSEGADYVNLGPVYPTQTKAVACGAVGEALIKEAAPLLKIPFTVMGGIKQRHIPGLLAIGARKIAMVTEITMAEDITAKVLELRALFTAGI